VKDNLVRMGEKEICSGLVAMARESHASSTLSDLINDMAKNFAYGKAKLSFVEFLAKAKQLHLSKDIVDNFVSKIKTDLDYGPKAEDMESGPVSTGTLEKQKQMVREDILGFLENPDSLTGAESLFEFLETEKVDYPRVDFYNLFDEEFNYETAPGVVKVGCTLRKILTEKVGEKFAPIAAEAYATKFRADPRGFVMGFMMSKIITYDKNKHQMGFNSSEFLKLAEYVDSLGYDIEKIDKESLYQWLYADSREMAKYARMHRIDQTRKGVRERISLNGGSLDKSEIDQDGNEVIFDENFDVSAFFEKYIQPELFRFKSKKNLHVTDNIITPDLFHQINSPEKLSQVIYSAKHISFFRDLVAESEQDPKGFLWRMRRLMAYGSSPQMKQKMDKLSNVKFLELISGWMDKAVQKYKRNLFDAMSYRIDAKVRLTEEFSYLKEILECRDIAKIIAWMVYPEQFKAKFPQYSHVPEKIIAHQAMVMFKEMLFISKRVVSPEYVLVYNKREMLERDRKKVLNLQDIKAFGVKYRLLREIVPNGDKPKFRVAFERKDVGKFIKKDHEQMVPEEVAERVMNDQEQDRVEIDGKVYEVFPIEMGKFKKVKITLSLNAQLKNRRSLHPEEVKALRKGSGAQEKYEMEVLIYNGDSHYIHVKDEIARLLSESRGKEVSDENRWLLVFANEQNEEMFKRFESQNNARKIISWEDSKNNTFISTKSKKSSRVGSSKDFKSNQSFKITKEYDFPDKQLVLGEDGKLTEKPMVTSAVLETQGQTLENLFIYNISDYSPSSHSTYRAKRAWSLMPYYFNPQVWGDGFQKVIDQGPMFNGD
jgi:hypothetical protein